VPIAAHEVTFAEPTVYELIRSLSGTATSNAEVRWTDVDLFCTLAGM
jgi:hypothetical protein